MTFSMPGSTNEIRPQDRHESGAAADRPGLGGEIVTAQPPQMPRSRRPHHRCPAERRRRSRCRAEAKGAGVEAILAVDLSALVSTVVSLITIDPTQRARLTSRGPPCGPAQQRPPSRRRTARTRFPRVPVHTHTPHDIGRRAWPRSRRSGAGHGTSLSIRVSSSAASPSSRPPRRAATITAARSRSRLLRSIRRSTPPTVTALGALRLNIPVVRSSSQGCEYPLISVRRLFSSSRSGSSPACSAGSAPGDEASYAGDPATTGRRCLARTMAAATVHTIDRIRPMGRKALA